MRRLLLPAACFLLAIAGCSGDGRTRLLVYSPHGHEMLDAYEAAFEAEHPDVDVQWLDMGSQEAFERVRSEAANPQASVWWGAPQTLFMEAAEADLLEPFAPDWAEALPATARDPQGRWYGTFLTPEGLLYNTKALDSTEVPQTWDALLDPAWKGRIAIRSPLESGTMRTLWGAMILRQPTVEDGYRWLARLDENTKGYPADPTQLYLQVGRGDADLTLWNLPDTFLQQQSYPFAFAAPAAGTVILVDGIAIPQGAPQPEIARQFIDFVTTPQALADQAQRFHRIPARTDVPAESLPAWMRGDAFREMPLDWARLAADGAEWMQVWDEQIKGRGAEYLAEHP